MACFGREQVGFPTRNPDKLVRALHFTHALMWIRATRKSRMARSGQLLGFARATSDGALSATIWDVAVGCLFRHPWNLHYALPCREPCCLCAAPREVSARLQLRRGTPHK